MPSDKHPHGPGPLMTPVHLGIKSLDQPRFSQGGIHGVRNDFKKFKIIVVNAGTIRTIFDVLRQSANIILFVDTVIVLFETKVKWAAGLTDVG